MKPLLNILCAVVILGSATAVFADCNITQPVPTTLTVQSCRRVEVEKEQRLQEFAQAYPKGFVESARPQFEEEARQIVDSYRGVVIEAAADGGAVERYFYASTEAGACDLFKTDATVHVMAGGACCDGDSNPPCFLGFRNFVRSVSPTGSPAGVSEVREVAPGEEFSLTKGESVKLKDVDLMLTVTGFEYSPCPEGAQCIWSGLAVHYDLTIGGFTYSSAGSTTESEPIPAELPLEVSVKESDYQTYAVMTMTPTVTGSLKNTADPDPGTGTGGVKIIDANVDPKDFSPEVKTLFINSGTDNIPPPCPEGTHVEGEFCRKGSS